MATPPAHKLIGCYISPDALTSSETKDQVTNHSPARSQAAPRRLVLNIKSLDEMIEEAIVRKTRERGYTNDEDTSVPDTTERLELDSEVEEEPTLRRRKRQTNHPPGDSSTELKVEQVIDKRMITEYLVGYGGKGKKVMAQWVKKSDIPSALKAIHTFNRRLRECKFLGLKLPLNESQKGLKRGPGRPRKSLLRPQAQQQYDPSHQRNRQ